MPTLLETPPMTADEFLSLPDNGTDRWLINGELREKPIEYRDRFSSIALTKIASALGDWNNRQQRPRGVVYGGGAGVIFTGPRESLVGVAVAYVSPARAKLQTPSCPMIDQTPDLIVEIPSLNDTEAEISEKINVYRAAGVPLVWIVNASRKTVEIRRPGEEPMLVNSRGRLSAEPHLPGFEIDVAELFW